jgi:hypothetical protein
MKVNFAHIRLAAEGGYIDFAVFDAHATSGSSGNPAVLAQLTINARAAGLKVDRSALVYTQGGKQRFFGDKRLVNLLSRNGLPSWTHSIDA